MKWILPFVLLLALGACAMDPFEQDHFAQPGTWAPTNDNDANLRAMVADPHDLVAGKPMSGVVGTEGAMPVQKLLTGKRESLPSTSADTVYGASSSGGGSGSGSGSGSNGGS